jgi:hypothetical protein
MYLSEVEKSVKENIEESIREFFRRHDQLTLNKIKIDPGMLQSFPRDSQQNRQTSP